MRDDHLENGPPEPHQQTQLVPAGESAAVVRDAGHYRFDQHGDFVERSDMGELLRYYFALLSRYRWLILGSVLLGGLAGLLYQFTATTHYFAAVRIQIDHDTVKVVEGGSISASKGSGSEALRTEYELLKSRAMADRVVRRLSLADDQSFFNQRAQGAVGFLSSIFRSSPKLEEAPSREVLESRATEIVVDNVFVRPVRDSRLVQIGYRDLNPARAQRIANAYAQVYIDSNIEKRFEANTYAQTFLERQVKQLKLRLEESEKALLEFAERERIIATNEQATIAESNLTEANAQLGQLAAERIKNQKLWEQTKQTSSINMPQFLSNGVISTLRGQRMALMKEYEEKLETFKPAYPAMREKMKRIKEIDRQISAEIKTIRSSLKAGFNYTLKQEEAVKKRVEKLRRDVLALQKKRIQYNILKREVDSNQNLYNDLLKRYKEVSIAGGVGANNIRVVDPARGAASVRPRLARTLLLSLILGAGVGFGLALTAQSLDNRLRTPDEVEHFTGLPILGVIPRAGSKANFASEILDPRSNVTEAYRTLGTALQFSTASGLPRSLAVTSTGAGEGKSSTSFAIAQHFASLGLKTLLIDGDLRDPSLHGMVNAGNAFGLTNYLTGEASFDEVIQFTETPNLAFVGSGPLPQNAPELLGRMQLHSLVTIGLEAFDLIIIDGPPMLALADAQLISNAAAATLFVVAAGDQRKRSIRHAVRRLNIVHAPLAGIVLTKFDSKLAGYGYGAEYSDAAYGYGRDSVLGDSRLGGQRLETSA